MTSQPISPQLRTARPDDAQAISRLYQEAYRPADGGDPRQCYPFPQFLEPESVEDIIKDGLIRWFVAETNQQVIGTMGVVTNIGNDDDKVAECFGLVIGSNWRFHGLGTLLFKYLLESLASTDDAMFVIAETRTSHPGGWKAAKSCGFIPLGLEPFAHVTPVGSETMLLTGRITSDALARRNTNGVTSKKVLELSIPILENLNCHPLTLQSCEATHPFSNSFDINQLMSLVDGFQLSSLHKSFGKCHMEIYEDETALGPPNQLLNLKRHNAGVLCFQRLEGKDSQGIRYQRRLFLAKLNNQPVAYVIAVLDNLDRRLRILDLRSSLDGVQGLLIQHIVSLVEEEMAGRPLTVVLDVKASSIKLHATLQKLNFFPTVYYPALIADGDIRDDAVQFTRLFNLNYRESLVNANLTEWPSANVLVSQISEL